MTQKTAVVVSTHNDDSEVNGAWHQMPGEPDRAYAMFVDFLNVGGGRNISKVYREHVAKRWVDGKPERMSAAYYEMTIKYQWHERVKAFDNYCYELARARHIAQMNEAIDVLFAGAVPAAKRLVAAIDDKKTTSVQIMAATAVLNRCGLVERGTSYQAPITINSVQKNKEDKSITVKIEGASKEDLRAMAGFDDDK